MAPSGAGGTCVLCNKNFEGGAHRKVCLGSCEQVIHKKCWPGTGSMGLTKEEESTKEWRCANCPIPNVEGSMVEIQVSPAEAEIINRIHQLDNNQKQTATAQAAEVAKLQQQVSGLTSHVMSLIEIVLDLSQAQSEKQQNQNIQIFPASAMVAGSTSGSPTQLAADAGANRNEEIQPPPHPRTVVNNGNAAPVQPAVGPQYSKALQKPKTTTAKAPANPPRATQPPPPPTPRTKNYHLNHAPRNATTVDTSDIFVKTNSTQKKENKHQAAEDVKKLLTPQIVKDHIENVVVLNGTGTVVVKCGTKDGRNKVAEIIKQALGEKYDIKAGKTEPIKYGVLIHGVHDADLPTKKDGNVDFNEITRSLRIKNDIAPECFLQVAQGYKSNKDKNQPTRLIIRVEENIKQKILKNGIKFGYSRLATVDLGPFPTCTNCCAHLHAASRCTRARVCFVCASSEHSGSSCMDKHDTGKHKCINCANYNKKIESLNDPTLIKIDENHKATDRSKCHSYACALNNYMRKYDKD
jgi:hypothetical protein